MERNANAKAQAEPKVTVPPDANAEQADAPKTDESRRSKNARLGKQVHEASSGIEVFGDSVAIAPGFANPCPCKEFQRGRTSIHWVLDPRVRGATQLRSDPTIGLLMDLSCTDAMAFLTYLDATI